MRENIYEPDLYVSTCIGFEIDVKLNSKLPKGTDAILLSICLLIQRIILTLFTEYIKYCKEYNYG